MTTGSRGDFGGVGNGRREAGAGCSSTILRGEEIVDTAAPGTADARRYRLRAGGRRPGLGSLLAAALLVPGLVGEAAAQQPLDLDRYLALLGETRGGLFITSGRALAGYRPEDARRVVSEFEASGPQPLLLKTAALLHTEAAALAGADSEHHLDLADDLLRALPAEAGREDWLRRWWLAVCSSYQVALNSSAGVAAYERALADLPGDRELLEGKARMLQMIGRQREEQPYLAMAAETLESLLRETPDDAALRIRLAGVLVDLGRESEAAAQLDRVGGGRLAAMDRFALFLLRGEIALGAGDFAAAETAFSEALRRGRRSPSAVSGLVAARLGQGDRGGAAEAAADLLSRRPTRWEPEWRYWLGPALDYREMFEEMKGEVRVASEGGGR